MPKEKGRSKILKYDHGKIVQAVDAVRSGSMSIRVAATTFGVPKSTLGDKISGRSDLDTNIGRKPALPDVIENKIVNNVLEASKRGMGISKRQLFARTSILCKQLKVTPFKNGTPGRGWWAGLKKRHSELTIRKPEKLGNSRARMLNATVVSKYMSDLGKLLTDLNLHDKPQLIWNCDETGKQFQHTPVKVISQKGARNVISRVSENRTNITIMACVNGAGEKMVPMIIVKGKTSASLHGLNVREAPTGTVFAYQENGWMTEELGERWFKDVFLKHCGAERPQLLLLDGHSSHETLGLLELAVQERIQILCLPPHTTHMLQPLDRSVFGPFNAAYNTACSEFLSESPYHVVNKFSFPGLFKKSWETGLTKDNIANGFRACGIVPFNPQAITTDAYHPSVATEKPEPAAATGLVPKVNAEILEPAAATGSVPQINSTQQIQACITELSQSEPTPGQDGKNGRCSGVDSGAELVDDCVTGLSTSIDPVMKDTYYNIDDPEMLLSLIKSGEIEIVSADSDGVANFSQIRNDALEQTSATECEMDSVWNNAVESIFLPTPKENIPPKKSKAKTTHRLLTVDDVIAEKKEMLKKKELKQLKTQNKTNKKKNAN